MVIENCSDQVEVGDKAVPAEQVGCTSWLPIVDMHTEVSPASIEVLLIRVTATSGKEVTYGLAGSCCQILICPEPLRRQ